MKRLLSLILVVFAASCADGCSGAKVPPSDLAEPQHGRSSSEKTVRFIEDEALEGLKMTLKELLPASSYNDPSSVVDGKYISPKKAAAMLARTIPLEEDRDDRSDFAKRTDSLPPPRTGETINHPFPPPADIPPPSVIETGPLKVARFAPTGEVLLAPHVSVTFNQPMVAVSSQRDAALSVPASISPQPEGNWRWLGTRTLLFQPNGRMPMATDYKVTIPKGTNSKTGSPLEKNLSFKFSTPALGIKDKYPTGGPHGLSQTIFIGFDQKIDPNELINWITVKGDNSPVPIRLASQNEIENDERVSQLVHRSEEGRWIAISPTGKLPKNTNFQVALKKGSPSAEGPKVTPGEQAFSFRTYSPLSIQASHCNWNEECPPTANWRIDFNNPLDPKLFNPGGISVEPTIPGKDVSQHGDNIYIRGVKQGRTRYTVTLPASITDVFGQTLEKTENRRFDVGPAQQTLYGPGKTLVTLDPSGPRALPVHSTNHKKLKVQIYRTNPEDWSKWQTWIHKYRYEDANPGPPPGEQVFNKKVRTNSEADKLTQTMIDLEPHLKNGYGQFIVRVEPTKQPEERWRKQEVFTWVQVTDIGLAGFVDAEELLAWSSSLKDGSPLEEVDLQLHPGKKTIVRSDREGLARLELSNGSKGQYLLIANRGYDTALLPRQTRGNGRGWHNASGNNKTLWYTFDDRKMYRPSEELKLKGWIRVFEDSETGDVRPHKSLPKTLTWSVMGPRGNELTKGSSTLSKEGGFHLGFKLPKDVNLGTAWIQMGLSGGESLSNSNHRHSFEIQEFRRPEFEVSASSEAGPHVLGQEVAFTVNAKYYAGGGLAAAPVSWRAYPQMASFTPPNRGDWSFGPWRPWWTSRKNDTTAGETKNLAGTTDPIGQHILGIHFEAMNPPRPMTVRTEATVTDVNRQAWTARKEILLHPSDLYVGLKTDKGFYSRNKPIDVEMLVVGLNGEIQTGVLLKVEFGRIKRSWKSGKWTEELVEIKTCEENSSQDPSTCRFRPAAGGAYKVRAHIRDGHGRPNLTEIRLWVSGGQAPPSRDVEKQELTLVPEKRTYQPGDTARFLVQSPFYPAEGLLTVRRSGIVKTSRFEMKAPTHTLEVDIEESHIPNLIVQVDVVGSAVRTNDEGSPLTDLPRRVAYASGNLTFQVPPLDRVLSVSVAPRKEAIEPGKKTTIDLTVHDAVERPVNNAELAVVVVDESVLALSGYKLTDPISVFYASRSSGVSDYHQRAQILLSDPSKLVAASGSPRGGRMQTPMPMSAPSPARRMGKLSSGMASSPTMDEAPMDMVSESMAPEERVMEDESGGDLAEGGAISMRSNFSALALFAPSVTTNKEGKASVEVTVPDSLTRYRIMVVAVKAKTYGMGESAITARLPLMVRPSPPRFLNFGDRIELPIVLQNQLDRPLEVQIALRGTNIGLGSSYKEAAVPGPRSVVGKRLTVPAKDRIEVRFFAAAQMAGTARLQAVATSEQFSDAAAFEIPVWTPATAEAFAVYGEIDDGPLVQPVQAPSDVWPQFGGLEVTTSSTQLQALTDSVLYLVRYPFDCNEQISSRILAVAALRDVMTAFDTDGLPSAEEIERTIEADIKHLGRKQNSDGGFAFWRRGDRSWPYLSVHVAHAFARAADKRYQVPDRMMRNVKRYLQRIERHIPPWYSKESKLFIRSYALYVLHRLGDSDSKKATELFDELPLKDLPLEAQAWLLPIFAEAKDQKRSESILRHLGNRVSETASGVHFSTSYSDGAHVLLHSNRRADGIILEALIDVRPKSDLIPKIVRDLLGHRRKGRWSNTQENAFVLLALDRYFNSYEKVTPNFIARVWLGEEFAGQHKFKGRTTERARIDIPMKRLAKNSAEQKLIMQKDGAGRLYYRVGMRYAPRSLKLEPADYGFAIERVYEAVDEPDDVWRDDEGIWHILAGSRVRVRLTMVAPSRRYHVALVDPLPAGLETINPELAVSGTVPEDPSSNSNGGFWWWSRPWYEHQNMRDERVEAFTSLLWDGVHKYSYVARATTPGIFVVPPTKAEEMYHPETFGRGATDRVIVEVSKH